jgi:hypothetical protein
MENTNIEKITALKIFPEFRITLLMVSTSVNGIPIEIMENLKMEKYTNPSIKQRKKAKT